jgi:hypothetical protein
MGRGGLYLGDYADDTAASAAATAAWGATSLLPIGAYYITPTGAIRDWDGVMWTGGSGRSGYLPVMRASVYDETLSGLPTVDGAVMTAGEVVLLTRQLSATENGPWVVSAGAWARPTWFTPGSNCAGAMFRVFAGSQFTACIFQIQNARGTDVIGTDLLTILRRDGDQLLLPPRTTDFTYIPMNPVGGAPAITGLAAGGIYIDSSNNSSNFFFRRYTQAISAAPPWAITMRMIYHISAEATVYRGMCLVNTTPAPNRLVEFTAMQNPSRSEAEASCRFLWFNLNGTSAMIYVGETPDWGFSPFFSARMMWLRLYNDGVNIYGYASLDGVQWDSRYSIAAAGAEVGGSAPNLVGWGLDYYGWGNTGTAPGYYRFILCDHWEAVYGA